MRQRAGMRLPMTSTKLWPSAASRPIVAVKLLLIDSIRSAIESSTSVNGASAAMRSNTLRSPAVIRSARRRAGMSVMLARSRSAGPRQRHQPHLGLDLVAVRVAMQPFEYLRLAGSRARAAAGEQRLASAPLRLRPAPTDSQRA